MVCKSWPVEGLFSLDDWTGIAMHTPGAYLSINLISDSTRSSCVMAVPSPGEVDALSR